MDFYNEHDRNAAAWLRELQAAGAIPGGPVDERSIADLGGSDIAGRSAHFFAGVGGWPLALRLAGWPADLPVWTGSCPCQPFAISGKKLAEKDPRHLWPEFRRLISLGRPPVVFGEQVASSHGREWLGRVRIDLEGMGYSFGAADLCAPGVGAPHLRQRLFWVADADGRESGDREEQRGGEHGQQQADRGDHAGEWRPVVHSCECDDDGNCPVCGIDFAECDCPGPTQDGYEYEDRPDGLFARWVGDPHMPRRGEHSGAGPIRAEQSPPELRGHSGPGIGSPWSESAAILCRDGKLRRIPAGPQPVFFPLADGIPANLGDYGYQGHGEIAAAALYPIAKKMKGRPALLRGAGNAIVPQLAALFVRAFMMAKGIGC